jgi:thioredoxin-like negative regulator of GroEL
MKLLAILVLSLVISQSLFAQRGKQSVIRHIGEYAYQNQQLSKEDLKNIVPEKGPVLIEVGADWCIPCRQMEPLLNKIKVEHPELTLIKLDADNQQELLKQLKVRLIPAFIAYIDGKQVWKAEGMVTEQKLKRKLDL